MSDTWLDGYDAWKTTEPTPFGRLQAPPDLGWPLDVVRISPDLDEALVLVVHVRVEWRGGSPDVYIDQPIGPQIELTEDEWKEVDTHIQAELDREAW